MDSMSNDAAGTKNVSTKDENGLMLRELHLDDGALNMRFGGEPAQRFMEGLVAFFEQNGGRNFLTFTVSNSEKKYGITIQNCMGGQSPAERLTDVGSILDDIISAIDESSGVPGEIRDKVIYLRDYLDGNT